MLIQELPLAKQLRRVGSMRSPLGEWIEGNPLNPAWTLHTYENARTGVYFHNSILKHYAHSGARLGRDVLHNSLTPLNNGPTIDLINVYLDHGNSTVEHVKEAIAHAGPCTIIMGDFNTPSQHWDPEHPRFHPRGNTILDACIDHDITLLSPLGIHTWRQDVRSSLLDLVLTSRTLAANASCAVLPFGPSSDHAPVLLTAHLTFSPQPYKAIVPNSDEETRFIHNIAAHLQLVNRALKPNSSAEQVELVFRVFKTSLAQAYEESTTEHSPTDKSKSWWTVACTQAKERYFEDHSRESRKEYKATIRAAKRSHYDAIIDRAAENHRPWDLLSWTRAREQPRRVSPIALPGNTPPSPQTLFDKLHDQFTGGTKPTSSPNLATLMSTLPTRPWHQISTNEVGHVLRKAKKRSAPGGDHVSWTLLRKACDADTTLPSTMAEIFSKLVDSGTMPACFKHAETAIIPKPGKSDYTVLKAWRPIALLSCIAKLLMGIIARRLQFDAAAHDLVHPNQFGGLIGRSTTDAALLLTEKMHQAKLKGVASSLLAIDIAQFFPSIRHDLLLEILRRQGFAPTLIRFLASYLTERTVRYHWGSVTSAIYPFDVGIPQGCKISPVISALFIAPAFRYLCASDPEADELLISFVDDTVILTQSRSLTANAARLSTLYSIWEKTLHRFHLQIEHSKTEVFHARHYETHLPRKPLYNGPLPAVTIRTPSGPLQVKPSESWRYLGFFFDPALSFNSHIDKWTNKAYGSLRAMKTLGNSNRGLPPSHKRLLYLTAVLPIMTYGFQLWYRPNGKGCKKHIKKLAAVQHAAARWITGGFCTSPAGALECLAGLPSIAITLRNLYNAAIVRFCTLPPKNGLFLNAFPPLAWDRPSAGSIRHGPSGTFVIPASGKERKAVKRPPVEVLRDLAFQLEEPSPHLLSLPPGDRLMDRFPSRIVKQQYPPKTGSIDQWSHQITDILDAPFPGHTFFLLASPPANIYTGLGAYAYAHAFPDSTEPHITCQPASATNHHEISLIGLLNIITSWLPNIQGPVRILMRNQAATLTAFDESYKKNRHYARKIDLHLQHWLTFGDTNRLIIGWLPKQYRSEPIPRLETSCRRAKVQRQGELRGLSAASFLHEEQKTSNNLRDMDSLSPAYIGSSFIRLRTKKRRIMPRKRQALTYINACDDKPQLFARFTRAMVAHAPIGSYYKKFPHIGKDHRCPSPPPRGQPFTHEESRTHIFDHCSRFTRYWESWLVAFRLDDNSLELLVAFLRRNQEAFAFS